MKPLIQFNHNIIADHPPLHWFWNRRIANGSFNLLIGHPGVGKSLLAAELTAHASAGSPWPDAPHDCPTRSTEYPPHRGSVLYVSAEDSLNAVLLRRVEAAGANLDNVAFLREIATDESARHTVRFSLRHHLHQLAESIRSITCPSLVILDTLTSLLAPPVRQPCDPVPLPPQQSVTTVAVQLQELALCYGVTIIALAHVARRAESTALLRAHAALPFVGAARSAMWLTADALDPRTRHLVWLKAVESEPPPPLAFQIDAGPRIRWLDPQSPPPSAELDTTDHRADLLRDAAHWLASELATGPRPARQLVTAGRAQGFSASTLHRAKRLVGAVSAQNSVGAPWMWKVDLSSNKIADRDESNPDGQQNVAQ